MISAPVRADWIWVTGIIITMTTIMAKNRTMNKKVMVDDPANPGEQIEATERWLLVRAEVTTRVRRRVLPFSFQLKMEDEYWDKPWR